MADLPAEIRGPGHPAANQQRTGQCDGGKPWRHQLAVAEPKQTRQGEAAKKAQSDEGSLSGFFVLFDEGPGNTGQCLNHVLGRFAGQKRRHCQQRSDDQESQRGSVGLLAAFPKGKAEQPEADQSAEDGNVIEDQVEVGRIHSSVSFGVSFSPGSPQQHRGTAISLLPKVIILHVQSAVKCGVAP